MKMAERGVILTPNKGNTAIKLAWGEDYQPNEAGELAIDLIETAAKEKLNIDKWSVWVPGHEQDTDYTAAQLKKFAKGREPKLMTAWVKRRAGGSFPVPKLIFSDPDFGDKEAEPVEKKVNPFARKK